MTRRLIFALVATLGLATLAAAAPTTYVARYEDHGAGHRQLVAPVAAEPNATTFTEGAALGAVDERSYPQFVAEHAPIGAATIVELRSRDLDALSEVLEARGVDAAPETILEDGRDEVVTLVDGGPVANRIDLVFMGDGYTRAERQKFFDDIQRIVGEMFGGDTFKSYLPVFNVHAVFRASNESGIGDHDQPRDTAYGLYREGATLRAIYPSNTTAARASCNAAPGCDYPVIIANDPYYGGLGGEFAISTSSPRSGTVVLRHELGHTFGKIGEEYDGGGYFGANSSASLSGLKWRHWATEAQVVAEPVVARVLGWPWHQLSDGPYSTSFTSDGRFAAAHLRFSASGIETADTLSVKLDGQELPIDPPLVSDRTFYNLDFDHGFAAGRHTLTFEENVSDGNNWLSNLTVHEYGAAYHHQPGYIGAFPVFAQDGSVDGYRSNDEMCLMRNMESTQFCPVCQENNWIEFLGKVKLIDSLTSGVDQATGDVQVTLATQKLGQLRAPTADSTSRLDIKWLQNGTEVPALAGQTTWHLPARDASGTWQVEVRFVTPEIRQDPRNLTVDRRTITL